ncbi:MAG TPA: hypothetical protein VGM64_04225 [Lacunisphaera sp.]|jgi:hypothetical protein
MNPATESRGAEKWAVFISLAALVFFSRAWLIKTWGSPLPFWDQWDAEAIGLYAPWMNGSFHWADLFKAHNEHRIALTRLADLVLFTAYHGWNPWAQVLLNALLHAGTAVLLAAIFWPDLASQRRVVLVAGIAVLFTSACGWQNALYGFQSQVYFANLLDVIAIAGLCGSRPFCWRWWIGLLSGGLAFFSNAGGILAAVAAVAVGLISLGENRRQTGSWLALGLIAAVVALASSAGGSAPQHAAFHSESIINFLAVFAHCLAWPWINDGLFFLVMQLPLVWLVLARWREKNPLTPMERCALALGLFGFLQAAAIAYSRGGVLPGFRPLSRYQDPLLLGVVGQLVAMIILFSSRARFIRIAGLVWCAVAMAGLITLTETNFTVHLPFKRAQDRANLAIVRTYAATHDPAAFTSDPDFSGPHPNPRVVQKVIDDPSLRSTLPAEILAPASTDIASLPWCIRHSAGLTATSALLLLCALGLSLRRKSNRPDPAMPAQAGTN